MRDIKVPEGMMVVLHKDREAFPASQLTDERAMIVRDERGGRVLDEDRRVLGWLIPKETAVAHT